MRTKNTNEMRILRLNITVELVLCWFLVQVQIFQVNSLHHHRHDEWTSNPTSPVSVSTGTGVKQTDPILYYGWFFNASIASSLTTIYHSKYLANIYHNVTQVQSFLKNLSSSHEIVNPLEYYVKPLDPATGQFDPYYHVTAMFCGNQNCTEYAAKVQPYLGKEYYMNLIGYYFTERTFGIRILLTADQEEIFDDSTRQQRRRRSVPLEYPGIEFVPQNSSFNPSVSKAHVTLGCAPNIPAVATGLDLLDIVKYEQTAISSGVLNYEEFELEDGFLRRYHDGNESFVTNTSDIAFVFYPCQKIVTKATFEPYLMPSSSESSSTVGLGTKILLGLISIAMLELMKFL